MTEASEQVDLKTRSEGLTAILGEMVEPDRLAEIQRQVADAAATSYSANGSVWSAVIYMGWQVDCNGYQFNGRSWGIAFPGGGALFGTVYTDDFNRLVTTTHSFAF